MPRGSRRRPSHRAFAPPVPPPLGLARRVLPSGTVVWSVPHPLSAASPPCRFVLGRVGRCPPLPEVCVGGVGPCRLPFVARKSQARRKHGAGTRRSTRPSAGGGGGGMPCGSRRRPFYPALAPPVVPPPGLARRVPSSGTVVWSVPHPLTAAFLPCRVVLGGGGSLFAPPPTRIPRPRGGRGWVGGGGGAHVVSPSLHACRRHDAGTTRARGEALGCCGGGGGFPWAFPPFSMVLAPHPRTTSRCCPLAVVATSPHGAQCPVPAPSCAHTYWRRYVPGWKRMMRKCGLRGGLTVRLEGFLRHPPPWSRGGPLFRHPTARGGPTAHPLPGARASTSERPDTGTVVSVH